MITVDVSRNEQDLITAYEVSGHAGYADDGYDIICSAVSAITQTALLGLERHLKLHPSYDVNEKDGVLKVALNSAPTELTQTVLQTMVYGVQSIAKQCPQYVRIHEHRR